VIQEHLYFVGVVEELMPYYGLGRVYHLYHAFASPHTVQGSFIHL